MDNTKNIPLTKKQKESMFEFYSIPFSKVVFSKSQRTEIWNRFKSGKNIDAGICKICPAVFAEIRKAHDYSQNLQSAVFSECAYAVYPVIK